jgi:hypothetical protein
LDGTDGIRIAAFHVDSQYQCAQMKVDLRSWLKDGLYKELLNSSVEICLTYMRFFSSLVNETYLNLL